MRAGELRHRLTFKGPTHTNDGQGGITETWGSAFTIWGSLEPLKGKEFYDSQLINSEISGKAKVRYRNDIDPTMQIYFGTRTFKILSIINPGERDRELNLMVKEMVVV